MRTYHRPVASTPGAADDERRPLSLLFVYSWDVILAIFAGVGAVAVFSGNREVRGQTVPIPVAVQIFQALADAALATALFLIGTLLTRRQQWVRRAQIVVLLMDIALVAASVTVTMLTDDSARNLATALVAALFALVDALALVAMTAPRVTEWFNEPGQVPFYIGALVAFWAAASSAFFVLGLVS